MNNEIKDLTEIYEFLSSSTWNKIVERLTQLYEESNNVLVLTNPDRLYYVQGRLRTLIEMINLRDDIRAQLDELESD